MEIFLVEDSPMVLERLQDLLAGVPGAHLAGSAASAEAAIREILAARPEVVLLDLRLERGGGFDVLRAVREAAPEIDFYMLSNFAAEPYRRLAQRLGARDFFDKASEIGRVREVIAQRAALAT